MGQLKPKNKKNEAILEVYNHQKSNAKKSSKKFQIFIFGFHCIAKHI
jgi:hypothetical protein